jgi:hypothetical protein
VHKSAATAVAMLTVAALLPAVSAQTGNMVHIDPNFKPDDAMLQKLAPVLTKMGSGYNSLTNEVLGEGGCVTGTIIPPDLEGSSVSYQLDLVTSLDQFVRDTSVEASVSGSFGSFSASVKSTFEQSQKSNSTSTHLLIREYVQVAEVNLNNARLKIGKSLELLGAAKDPKQFDFFMRACGDQYVSTIYMGGEFIALLSSDSSDEELKQAIGVHVDASYGSSFSSSADFKQSLAKFKSKSDLSVTMTRIGGSGDLPVMSAAQGSASVDAILDYAAKLPSNVSKFPVMYNVKAQSYLQAGVNLPEFDTSAAIFGKLRKTEDDLGEAIVNLKLAQKSYDLLGVPIQPGPNDIQHVAQKNLAAAQADFATLGPIVQTCGRSFWRPQSCEAPVRFLENYVVPEPPLLQVEKLTTTSATPISVKLPVRMKVGLRGVYCYWGDHTDACLANGGFQPWKADQVYVNIDGAPYQGSEIIKGPSSINVQVHDADGAYGDNSGDLYFVAYPMD